MIFGTIIFEISIQRSILVFHELENEEKIKKPKKDNGISRFLNYEL